jgi:xylose isomerase
MNCILLGLNHFLHLLLFRRRESTDVEDLFIAHISGMDTLARGLRNVAKLIEVIN